MIVTDSFLLFNQHYLFFCCFFFICTFLAEGVNVGRCWLDNLQLISELKCTLSSCPLTRSDEMLNVVSPICLSSSMHSSTVLVDVNVLQRC